MFGCIVLGGLTALAIAKFWRYRRGGGWCRRGWYRGHGWGPGGHFEGDGFGPDFPGAGRRRGMGFALRYLSDRLEATPAQEKVIAQAVDEFRAEVEPLRQEGKKTRADVAATLRKSSIDEVLFGELFARHDKRWKRGARRSSGRWPRCTTPWMKNSASGWPTSWSAGPAGSASDPAVVASSRGAAGAVHRGRRAAVRAAGELLRAQRRGPGASARRTGGARRARRAGCSTPCSSTSCCRGWTGWRSAGASGRRAGSRSSC